MTRRFTGRHMAMIIVGFFTVVIGVNFLMAYQATSTFGGTVVDNSYVASQRYNGWLQKADHQSKLGWTIAAASIGGRAVVTVLSGDHPLENATLAGLAIHPLGREPDMALQFRKISEGRFISHQAMAAGRWTLHLKVNQANQHAAFVVKISS